MSRKSKGFFILSYIAEQDWIFHPLHEFVCVESEAKFIHDVCINLNLGGYSGRPWHLVKNKLKTDYLLVQLNAWRVGISSPTMWLATYWDSRVLVTLWDQCFGESCNIDWLENFKIKVFLRRALIAVSIYAVYMMEKLINILFVSSGGVFCVSCISLRRFSIFP
jgi:hypothetical protein